MEASINRTREATETQDSSLETFAEDKSEHEEEQILAGQRNLTYDAVRKSLEVSDSIRTTIRRVSLKKYEQAEMDSIFSVELASVKINHEGVKNFILQPDFISKEDV